MVTETRATVHAHSTSLVSHTIMYEDASWYSSFVPRAVKPLDKAKQHRRRESRLEQPSVSPPSAP